MNRTTLDFVEDIVEYLQKTQKFTSGMDYDAFARDERTALATVHSI